MTNQIGERILRLTALNKQLMEEKNLVDRLSILGKEAEVHEYFKGKKELSAFISSLTTVEKVCAYSLILLKETALSLDHFEVGREKEVHSLLHSLSYVEAFYESLGGLIGYVVTFMELLQGKTKNQEEVIYQAPVGLDLRDESNEVRENVVRGIKELSKIAAIFPIGGAGDRLDLHDEETGEPLPAAKLKFAGHTLLSHMFRDLQALEYIHFQLFKETVHVPVALMTSREKDNYSHIESICEEHHWFYRDKARLFNVIQPLVPVITTEGRLAFSAPLHLHLKPGGHGVIWKLAIDSKVFADLEKLGVTKGLVRQVNNPVASTDHTMLGLLGRGFVLDGVFGVVACDRPLHIAEGMVVLKRKEEEVTLTNVEYTDFVKEGISDVPVVDGSSFSKFPANTNLLFIDLKAIEKIVEKNPFPGLLVNAKQQFTVVCEKGDIDEVYGGRLESIMQNVADHLYYASPRENRLKSLPSFVVLNQREKTLSTTKSLYHEGGSFDQTPEKAFFDLQENFRTLLKIHCRCEVPEARVIEESLERGPPLLVTFHPALGPLWEVIGQKIRVSTFKEDSELYLEVAEVDIEALTLEGSLVVHAEHSLGQLGEDGFLIYGQGSSRISLKEVSIVNRGVDRKKIGRFWEGDFPHHESLEIILRGESEFHAEGVTFKGSYRIEVPDKHRMIAKEEGGKIRFHLERLKSPTWEWSYSVDENFHIVLKRRLS